MEPSGTGFVYGMGIFFGGLGQFVAGLLEYPRRNTFGVAAFCSYGAFWMGLSLFDILRNTDSLLDPSPSPKAAAMFLSFWAILVGGAALPGCRARAAGWGV